MEYKVLELCEQVKGNEVTADPDTFFPATLERIRSVKGLPPEIVGEDEEAGKRFMQNAKRIKPEAFELALQPFSEFDDEEAPTTQFLRAARADALALAESYFSRALAIAIGGPVKLHILKSADWKR